MESNKLIRLVRNNRFWLVVKLGLSAILIYYLHDRIRWSEWVAAAELLKTTWTGWSGWALGISFIALFLINWCSDTWLWWIVARQGAKIGFGEAFRINLMSHAVGMITPANLGEYGIKALHFTGFGQKRQSILLTFSYRAAKWFIKTAAGLFAGLWLWWGSQYMLVVACGLLLAGLAFAYPYIPRWMDLLYHSRWGRLAFGDEEMRTWDFKSLPVTRALLPATLKFMSYSGQLALLLSAGTGLNFPDLYWRSAAVYSLSSVIPTLSVFDPLVKTGIGDLIIVPSGVELSWLALCASVVWMVNLGLPSIAGFALWWHYPYRKVRAR